ncbi:hypothetical protein PF005_g33643 [Phytophthora fragariae]|uniref:Uncharacterized protein n=1 Tax=Phytophthora fragariae TaxID=53985 RepID=A0A6A3EKS3_9STRA|nr:hypothetical protein PF009_g15932 [Phytophthora fragariae]KAE9053455.1 hypothetical protein PF007_g32943 [Phytophthora fragariae]KAE9070006.1 hypothetical protein PF010_g26454 [Phytophthora fragariae]KAE9146504.1 hypothetical protein PF005_g33643 [Phytophthora fragariae]KAE9183672.1 hypothetical protein PF004_g23886 [Phytophthora fragariae]
MWAHPETTKLARCFMGLLVLDCTYKTNKYRLPLLDAIVVTGMNYCRWYKFGSLAKPNLTTRGLAQK